MKRRLAYIIFAAIVAVVSLPAAAQHYIGAKGGYGGAQGRFYPQMETSLIWNKYTGGVMWKYYSEQQVVGGVSAELEYQMRGFRVIEGVVSDTTSYTALTRTVGTITVPLIWQPHLYFANRHVRVFLNAGVTFSYNLGLNDQLTTFTQTADRDGVITSTTTETAPYTMITARDNRWNYGLCGGLGLGVLFGRWEVFAEARYYYGMSDIIRNKTKYQFNELGTIRSELDNLFVNVGFFIRLGQGGIKAAPLKRNREKRPDTNDFRNIKLQF